MNDVVAHKGKVISASDTHVFVQIERGGACSGCKNKQSCQIIGSKDQIISVKTDKANTYFPDEDVQVLMRTSLGMRAVLYAYVLPFVFLLATFLTVRQFISSEIVQILCAFIPVVAYYFILYKVRNKLEQTFEFFLEN